MSFDEIRPLHKLALFVRREPGHLSEMGIFQLSTYPAFLLSPALRLSPALLLSMMALPFSAPV